MTEYITSPANEFIKSLAALKQKKYRDQNALFIAEGVHLVTEALHSQWDIEACIYTREAKENREVAELLQLLIVNNCRLVEVTSPVYKKVSDTEQGQGIVVVVRKSHYQLSDLCREASSNRVFVVLDSLQDPGNVGTIIRTADAAGCHGVILTEGCADLFSGKTVRASMGSLFHMPVVEGVSSKDVIDFFATKGINLMVTALNASELYHEVDYAKNVAIVFGNEGQGVSNEMLSSANQKIHIPIYGQAESLNVAMSAAIILYEAARQRRLNL